MNQNLVGSITATCRPKYLKQFRPKMEDDRHGCHLENLFLNLEPIDQLNGNLVENIAVEPIDQLNGNLVENIAVTLKLKPAKTGPIGPKIAKSILSRNKRRPPWPPSGRSILKS